MSSVNLTILCVDDNPADLEIQANMLEHAGYRVLQARDTHTALAAFMLEEVELVLLDFNLIGTDGAILAAEMKRWKPDVRVAYLCGAPDANMDRTHVDAIFGKSLDPADLVREVESLLATSEREASQRFTA